MSKMENNTVNKAGSTGVELNLNDGTQRYQVTKKDLKKTADRYNFMACNIFNYESQMGPAVAWAMAPVLLTALVYKLLGNKKWTATKLILLIIVIALVCSFFGILTV